MLEQAEASIMYLGLNCRHCMGPGWSAFMTATLTPVSVFQQWIRPSVDPQNANLESGLNEASRGIPLLFWKPIKVWSGVPWKASMSRRICPLVEMRISFPSGLNFIPVQSQSLSCVSLKVVNGPLSNDRRSYSLTHSEFIPAAKMRPSGSRLPLGDQGDASGPDSFVTSDPKVWLSCPAIQREMNRW